MRIPKLCHHKPSGRAYVRVDRKCQYLGPWGSEETERAYNAFVVQYLKDRDKAIPKPKSNGLTVRQLTTIYLEYAEGYFSDAEMPGQRAMIKWINDVAGDVTANAFGPRMLERVREAMIAKGNSRKYINQQHGRIVAMFNYGVEKELVKPTVPMALKAVKKLKPGRSAAKERPKVEPAPDDDILAALEFMPDDVATMCQLQLLLACRPGELWVMRPCDIDREPDRWRYRPSNHKNKWREKERVITVGPHAQELLKPYLLRPADRLCFTTPTGRPWDRFTYRDAFHEACRRAGVPPFNPYQLRHNAGTEIRRLFGLEGVQSRLGHATRAVSEVYADVDDANEVEIARRIG